MALSDHIKLGIDAARRVKILKAEVQALKAKELKLSEAEETLKGLKKAFGLKDEEIDPESFGAATEPAPLQAATSKTTPPSTTSE